MGGGVSPMAFTSGNFNPGVMPFGTVGGTFGSINPGFTGGFQANPNFASVTGMTQSGGALLPTGGMLNSQASANFAFNPTSGFNPMLGNPMGFSGVGAFNGNTLGSNPLMSNPVQFHSASITGNLGSNPGLFNPMGPVGTPFNNIGANPLVQNPIGAVTPGGTANFLNNPLVGNPMSPSAFSGSPIGLATGQNFGQNGFPLSGGSLLHPAFLGINSGPLLANQGFGSSMYLQAPFIAYTIGALRGQTGGTMSPYYGAGNKYALYDMMAARYGVGNGRVSRAGLAASGLANFALANASKNYKRVPGMRPFYPLGSKRDRFARRGGGGHAPALIPPSKVIDDKGEVLWPDSAPSNTPELSDRRQAVDKAVQRLYETSKEGRAPVQEVVETQNTLEAYGTAALKAEQDRDPKVAEGLALFLQSLDRALTVIGQDGPARLGMAEGTGQTQDLKPDSAPKTGGEVLLKKLQKAKEGPDQ